jgi:hypothetical protein
MAPVPATTVRLVTAGGMATWQIILIAVTAALVTAIAAVVLDRAGRPPRRPGTQPVTRPPAQDTRRAWILAGYPDAVRARRAGRGDRKRHSPVVPCPEHPDMKRSSIRQ